MPPVCVCFGLGTRRPFCAILWPYVWHLFLAPKILRGGGGNEQVTPLKRALCAVHSQLPGSNLSRQPLRNSLMDRLAGECS
jgi:hypothetical protein